jgi:hypothetical protein
MVQDPVLSFIVAQIQGFTMIISGSDRFKPRMKNRVVSPWALRSMCFMRHGA